MQLTLSLNGHTYQSLLTSAILFVGQMVGGENVNGATLQSYLNAATEKASKNDPDINSDVFQHDILVGVSV